MNMNKWDEIIIAYYESELSQEGIDELFRAKQENHAVSDLFDDYGAVYRGLKYREHSQPSGAAKQRFDDFLAQESSMDQPSKVISLSWMKYAVAASMIILVSLIGYNSFIGGGTDEVPMSEACLDMQRMMENDSPSERIKAITVGYTEQNQNVDNYMLDILLNVLETDKSSNVRLAAVETLSDYTHIDRVRSALITALQDESDAAVKIGIVQAISADIKPETEQLLERIKENQSYDPFVRDEANMRLIHLKNI